MRLSFSHGWTQGIAIGGTVAVLGTLLASHLAFADTSVSTEAQLRAALNDPAQATGTITLGSDISVSSSITIPASFQGNIDGAGHSITASSTNPLSGGVLGDDAKGMLIASGGSRISFRNVTLNGSDAWRTLWMVSGSTVTMEDATVTNGYAPTADLNDGGGIMVFADNSDTSLTLTRVTMKNSQAFGRTDETKTGNGGAIAGRGQAIVTITDGTFTGNKTGGAGGGGAIAMTTGPAKLTVHHSSFDGNVIVGGTKNSTRQGGAIFQNGGTLTVDQNSTFNISKGFNTGGAIYLSGATANIDSATFTMNDLGDGTGISGGAVLSGNSNTTITNSTFSTVGQSTKLIFAGGFIDVVGSGSLTLRDSTLTGNGSWWNGPSLATYGGAIAFETGSSATALIENTSIKNFTTDENGGAISVSTRKGETSSVNLTIRNSTIQNTRTRFAWKNTYGGGIYLGPGNTMSVEGGKLTEGFSVLGGSIYNDGITTLTGGLNLTDNTTYQIGGGVYNNGVLTVDQASLTNNRNAEGRTQTGKSNPTEMVGGNIYAKKDVTITPNASFDANDVRVLDQESAIILTGSLTRNIKVSVSEKPGGYDETQQRYIGYTIARGNDSYVPTDGDADRFTYATLDETQAHAAENTNPVPASTAETASWDYVRNPDANTVVLGQRAKMIYHANHSTPQAQWADGSTTKDQIYTFYSSTAPWSTPAQMTRLADQPSLVGYELVNWYNSAVSDEDVKNNPATGLFDFTSSFTSSTAPITSVLNPAVMNAYAGWRKAPTATHVFEACPGVTETLPADIAALHPADKTFTTGTTVKATEFTHDPIEKVNGTWTFSGTWTPDKVENATRDVKFVGCWNFEVKKLNADHVFYVKNAPASKTSLPTEVTSLTPADKQFNYNTNVEATNGFATSVTVTDGTWTFDGWDTPSSYTNRTEDAHFRGGWNFTLKKLNKTHEFTVCPASSGTLPAEVTAKLPASSQFDYGQTVEPDAFDTTPVTIASGTWTFSGTWTPDKVENATRDVKFVGCWNFEVKKLNADHVFYVKNAPASKTSLPTEVTSLTPADKQFNYNTNVEATNGFATSVTVTDGTWTFDGWDTPSSYTNRTEDAHFRGGWNFTLKKLNATHTFAVCPAQNSHYSGPRARPAVVSALPAEVLALLPQDFQFDYGTDPHATAVSTTTVEADGARWTFHDWDPASFTNATTDITFPGCWSPEKIEYTQTHEFVADPAAGRPLPQGITDLTPESITIYHGERTVPLQPAEDTYAVTDGTWTFSRLGDWDHYKVDPITGNVHYIGTWHFAKTPLTATHEFRTCQAGMTLPEEISALLPADRSFLYGDDVAAGEVSSTGVTVPEGQWSFHGWENSPVTSATTNLTFTGCWDFTPNPVIPPKVSVENPKKGKIARTGADALSVGAFAALAAGAGMFLIARRRRSA